MQNPSSCQYECGKSCDVGEYLDYENCKCRKILVDKLVEECSENVDGIEMISVNLNDYKNVYYSCTVYNCIICRVSHNHYKRQWCFHFFYWYLKKNNTGVVNITPSTETTIS